MLQHDEVEQAVRDSLARLEHSTAQKEALDTALQDAECKLRAEGASTAVIERLSELTQQQMRVMERDYNVCQQRCRDSRYDSNLT